MKPPSVTVLLAVKNGEPYLRSAIESVLCQSLHDFELVFIDDASIDNSQAIIESLPDRRIKFLKNKDNLGLTKSLNLGLQRAQGKYVARLDADDIMLPQRLQLQVEYLDKHPVIALVGGWAEVIDEHGKVIGHKQTPTEPLLIKYEALTYGNPLTHSSIMFRRDAVAQLKGYDESFKYAQDYDLYSRLLRAGYRLANLDRILVKFRKHDGMLSRKPELAREQADCLARILRDNINFLTPISEEVFELLTLPERLNAFKNLRRALALRRKIHEVFCFRERLDRPQRLQIQTIYRRQMKLLWRWYLGNLLKYGYECGQKD
jgi:glycosyltransferase involved in cell wall biosynthesis